MHFSLHIRLQQNKRLHQKKLKSIFKCQKSETFKMSIKSQSHRQLTVWTYGPSGSSLAPGCCTCRQSAKTIFFKYKQKSFFK